MTRHIRLRNHPAERLPEHDGFINAQCLTECVNIIAPIAPGSRLGIAGYAAPVAPVIQIDHLRHIAQRV